MPFVTPRCSHEVGAMSLHNSAHSRVSDRGLRTSEYPLIAEFAEQLFCEVGRTGRLLVIRPSRGDHLQGVGPQRAEGGDLRAVGP